MRCLAAEISGGSPVATQIAVALENEGLCIELNLGTSGFRVPLAVGQMGEMRGTAATWVRRPSDVLDEIRRRVTATDRGPRLDAESSGRRPWYAVAS